MPTKKSLRKRLAAATAACAVVVGAAACGSDDSSEQSDAGRPASDAADRSIVVTASGEPGSLDPHLASDPSQALFLWEVYESLTEIRNGEVLPLLASELPGMTSDTTWQVPLLEGVTFSDGSVLDAEDVIYSLGRISDPDYPTGRAEATTIVGLRAIDDLTVEITTRALDPLLPNKLAGLKIMPVGMGDDLDNPVGSGPYMLTSYDPATAAVIEANPEYRGETPDVTKITVRFIGDAETRLQSLEAGEVDLVPNISPGDFDRVPKVIASANPVMTYNLRINNHQGPLSDPRVRQAVNHAIDKASIVETFFPNEAAVVSPCLPGAPTTGNAADPPLSPYAYDPAKAKQLLEDAGALGTKLTFDGTTGVSALDREVSQVIAQQLGEAGFEVDLVLNDYSRYIDKFYATGAEGPDLLYSYSTDSQGNIEREVLAFYLPDGAGSTYADDALAGLVDQATVLPIGSDRQNKYNELLGKACDDAALGFLFARKGLYGASERIEFTPVGPDTAPTLSDIELVDV